MLILGNSNAVQNFIGSSYIKVKVIMANALELLSEHESNLEWFNRHYQRLKKNYMRKWIAVKGERVIDNDPSHSRLVARLKKTHEKEYQSIAVAYISEKPIELIL